MFIFYLTVAVRVLGHLTGENVTEGGERVVHGLIVDAFVQVLDEHVANAGPRRQVISVWSPFIFSETSSLDIVLTLVRCPGRRSALAPLLLFVRPVRNRDRPIANRERPAKNRHHPTRNRDRSCFCKSSHPLAQS